MHRALAGRLRQAVLRPDAGQQGHGSKKPKTMSSTLEAALMKASDNGRYPGHHGCQLHARRFMQKHLAGRLKLFDFHEFAHDALLPRLMITKAARPDRAAHQLQRAQAHGSPTAS
jgi:hypothetical protein